MNRCALFIDAVLCCTDWHLFASVAALGVFPRSPLFVPHTVRRHVAQGATTRLSSYNSVSGAMPKADHFSTPISPNLKRNAIARIRKRSAAGCPYRNAREGIGLKKKHARLPMHKRAGLRSMRTGQKPAPMPSATVLLVERADANGLTS